MSFFKGVGAFVGSAITNENARSMFSAATSQISEMMTSSKTGEPEGKIEKVSESRLKKMLKHDSFTVFSCHSEASSNGPIFYTIFLPDFKSVWKSSDEKAVRQLCAKLNPLTDVAQDKSKMASRLETLMSVVWKEPDWVAIHYAVACGFTNYLTSMIQQDTELVLAYATADGRYPLNIAAEMAQTECLRLLLDAGAPLTQQDARGRTVVHWAATSSVVVLQELSSAPSFQRCLLVLDGDGLSPLSSAIRASNFEAVQLLMGLSAPLGPLASGPLLNALVGLKPSESLSKVVELITTVSPAVVEQVDGNNRTVFHKSLDPQVLSALLRKSYRHINLNRKDKIGSTALHLAVERGDIDSAVVLLTYGADVDGLDGKGETALMKAASGDNVLLVKALLVFDANVDKKTPSGQDVFTLSATSKKRANIEEVLNIAGLKKEVSAADKNQLEEFAQKLAMELVSKESPRTTYALSLDGGGIRGLVLIQMLIEIEKKLGHPVMEHFEWLAGTSTGAILALALSQGKSPAHCRNLYFRLKDDVFTGKRPFSAASLERLLKEEFGEGTTMAQVAMGGKRVMVTTCQANISPPQLFLIRSYKLSPISGFGDLKSSFSDPSKTLAWMAARCSSAAPTYFPSVNEMWMDGGLIANNPCCELLTDIQTFNTACRMDSTNSEQPVRLGCVLSLGTGKSPIVEVKAIDLDLPKGIQDFGKVFSVIDSMVHLKSVLIEQAPCFIPFYREIFRWLVLTVRPLPVLDRGPTPSPRRSSAFLLNFFKLSTWPRQETSSSLRCSGRQKFTCLPRGTRSPSWSRYSSRIACDSFQSCASLISSACSSPS